MIDYESENQFDIKFNYSKPQDCQSSITQLIQLMNENIFNTHQINYLLKTKININQPLAQEYFCLPNRICQEHFFIDIAAARGLENFFFFFLNKGAYIPNIEDRQFSSFSYAIIGNNDKIIKYFLTNKSIPSCAFKKSFCYIIKRGDSKQAEIIMQNLMEKFEIQDQHSFLINPFFVGQTVSPLELAIKSLNVDMFNFIKDIIPETIYQKENHFSNKRRPILIASKVGSLDILQSLIEIYTQNNTILEELSQTDENGNNALMLATKNLKKYPGCINCILKILETIFSPFHNDENKDFLKHSNKNGDTVLNLAINSIHFNFVQFLLNLPPNALDVNHKNSKEITALHQAVLIQNIDILDLLLSYDGINVNLKDTLERTAYIYCAQNDWVDGFEHLIKKDLNGLRISDKSKLTPILWAGIFGSCKILQKIIDLIKTDQTLSTPLKAYLHDFCSFTGWNILHYAAHQQQVKAIQILFNSCLVDDLICSYSLEPPATPLYYAVKNNNLEIADMFFSKMRIYNLPLNPPYLFNANIRKVETAICSQEMKNLFDQYGHRFTEHVNHQNSYRTSSSGK